MANTAVRPHHSQAITKRKLDDAINSLDEVFRVPIITEPSGKKRRIKPPITSTPALLSLLSGQSSNQVLKHISRPPPLSYNPSSLPSLLTRIQTFSLSTFSPDKPPSLSPAACALRGWINVAPSRERLKCVTCERSFVLSPPSNGWPSTAGEKLKVHYEASLAQEHSSTCPWKIRGCEKRLYAFKTEGRSKTIENLIASAHKAQDAAFGELRLCHPLTQEELAMLDEAMRSNSVQFELNDEEVAVSSNNILLALFAWTVLPTDPNGLQCTYCARKVLTTSYLPSTATHIALEVVPTVKSFDLVSQHQAFCPVINSAPFGRTGESIPKDTYLRPGWRQVLDMVTRQNRRASDLSNFGFQMSTSTSSMNDDQGAQRRKLKDIMSYVQNLLGSKKVI